MGGTSLVPAESRGVEWCATLVHIQSWEVCNSSKRFHVSRPEILAMGDLPLQHLVVFFCSEHTKPCPISPVLWKTSIVIASRPIWAK